MKKIVLSFLLAVSSISFGQTKDELDLCMAIQANSFTSNTEAENALDRILDVIGASKNFVLTPCDKISNAVATAYKGTRYILYDREFMKLISKNTNDWSNLFIFAHEVGHHINGHSIDLLLYTNDVVDSPSLEKSRKQELEADEFAAFVLAKLGANLSQLNNVITLISDNSDDTYSTHPKREKRLASVRVGFNKGYENKRKNNDSKKDYVFANEEELINFGNWSVSKTSNNNPFEEDISVAYTKGKIMGKNVTFKFAPRLIVRKKPISFELEFIDENEIKRYFFGVTEPWVKGGSIYRGANIGIQMKVVDSNGKEIDETNGWSIKPLKKQRNKSILYLRDCNSWRNERIIRKLKKGSKLYIKMSGESGSYYINKGWSTYKRFKNSVKKIPEFENLIFEYSLSGSSKALAD